MDEIIQALKKEIDRTLLRENLKLTPEERLNQLMNLQKFAGELRSAGKRANDKLPKDHRSFGTGER